MIKLYEIRYNISCYNDDVNENEQNLIFDNIHYIDEYLFAEDENDAIIKAKNYKKEEIKKFALNFSEFADYSFIDGENYLILIDELSGDLTRYDFRKEWVKELWD